jgi:hypothetical protein
MGVKDIRMGNIFFRWALQMFRWAINFSGGRNIFTMGVENVPMGKYFLRWAIFF